MIQLSVQWSSIIRLVNRIKCFNYRSTGRNPIKYRSCRRPGDNTPGTIRFQSTVSEWVCVSCTVGLYPPTEIDGLGIVSLWLLLLPSKVCRNQITPRPIQWFTNSNRSSENSPTVNPHDRGRKGERLTRLFRHMCHTLVFRTNMVPEHRTVVENRKFTMIWQWQQHSKIIKDRGNMDVRLVSPVSHQGPLFDGWDLISVEPISKVFLAPTCRWCIFAGWIEVKSFKSSWGGWKARRKSADFPLRSTWFPQSTGVVDDVWTRLRLHCSPERSTRNTFSSMGFAPVFLHFGSFWASTSSCLMVLVNVLCSTASTAKGGSPPA